MRIGPHDIAVCSWSLQPRNTTHLLEMLKDLGLQHVQIAVLPLLELEESQRREALDQIRRAGVMITAGMLSFPGEDYSTIAIIRETGGYVPEKTWEQRRRLTVLGAELSQREGISLLSVHVGFIPPSNHPAYPVLLRRIAGIASELAERGIELLLETGQERAAELLQFLNDLAMRNVHVNFDPANMILYGAGDPVEAVRVLGRHIRHVHLKDAKLSRQPGIEWGEEVVVGTGEVGVRRFLAALHEVGYTGPLALEREAGNSRLADLKQGIRALQAAC